MKPSLFPGTEMSSLKFISALVIYLLLSVEINESTVEILLHKIRDKILIGLPSCHNN